MTFKDIFKKSFLDGFASTDFSTKVILIALFFSVCFALYIFLIYRTITRNTFYSKSFNLSLACTSVITAALILTMQSNIALSLGMVGALSIVRFRTAIKDPMDLTFLFWAISVGIICGAGLIQVALILSIVLTAAIFMLDQLPAVRTPMLLVINASDIDIENKISGILSGYCKKYKVKSRNISRNSLDLIIELRVSDGQNLIKDISRIEGMGSVSLLDHEGEVTA